MPKVVGGLLALVAIGSGILAHVDPTDCLLRAFIAFILGSLSTQAWYVFFTIRTRKMSDFSAAKRADESTAAQIPAASTLADPS